MSMGGPRRPWLAVVGLLMLTGCGGKVKPVPTTGVVTLDGEAVAGALVTFMPEEAGGSPASALTEEDGTFSLVVPQGNGAFPGGYRVVVVKYDMSKRAHKRSPSLLPKEYSSKATSPLRCTVPHAGPLILELHRAKR